MIINLVNRETGEVYGLRCTQPIKIDLNINLRKKGWWVNLLSKLMGGISDSGESTTHSTKNE